LERWVNPRKERGTTHPTACCQKAHQTRHHNLRTIFNAMVKTAQAYLKQAA
jgi:hypothetical protein